MRATTTAEEPSFSMDFDSLLRSSGKKRRSCALVRRLMHKYRRDGAWLYNESDASERAQHKLDRLGGRDSLLAFREKSRRKQSMNKQAKDSPALRQHICMIAGLANPLARDSLAQSNSRYASSDQLPRTSADDHGSRPSAGTSTAT